MKTVLITAYAVNPFKGSENGMGWHFINEISKEYQVIAITRENNLPAIERYLLAHPEGHHKNVQWVGFDLPKYQRFWKRGSFGSLPYYYLWQRRLPAFVRKQGFDFELVHNLNFHNDWTPSFLWKLGKPFLWGPIGHHPLIPQDFLRPVYGWKAWAKDRFRWLVKKAFWKMSPALRHTAAAAEKIFAMNTSVQEVLNLPTESVALLPSVGTEYVAWEGFEAGKPFEVLSVGRFVDLKGFDLTIEAFAAFYHRQLESDRGKLSLRLIGKGPAQDKLKALVKAYGLEEVVHFVPWVDRAELEAYYRSASVFLFPSHEGAGMVVSEAMSYGLPVVCLDNCGPGEFVTESSGIKVPYGEYRNTCNQLAEALHDLHADPQMQEKLSLGARERFLQHFDWQAKGAQMRAVYAEVLADAAA